MKLTNQSTVQSAGTVEFTDCITGSSSSDCLVWYARHSLRESYPFAEVQSEYSTVPADWIALGLVNRVYMFIYRVVILLCGRNEWSTRTLVNKNVFLLLERVKIGCKCKCVWVYLYVCVREGERETKANEGLPYWYRIFLTHFSARGHLPTPRAMPERLLLWLPASRHWPPVLRVFV